MTHSSQSHRSHPLDQECYRGNEQEFSWLMHDAVLEVAITPGALGGAGLYRLFHSLAHQRSGRYAQLLAKGGDKGGGRVITTGQSHVSHALTLIQ